MIIYLYHKRHKKTNLNYFGKTVKNPHTYNGSGVRWLHHLKKYGKNIETVQVWEFDNLEKCSAFALEFSKKHNIVESNDWANLVLEDAGINTDLERKWWNNGINQTFSSFPPDNTFKRGRLIFNNIGAKMGADIQRNKHWITDGKNEMMVLKDSHIPNGYSIGRLVSKKKGNPSDIIGYHWWNNGSTQKMAKESPGKDYMRGRLGASRIWWNNGLQESWSVNRPGEDYLMGRLKKSQVNPKTN